MPTYVHWQAEQAGSAAEPLISTTGNKSLYYQDGANINFNSTYNLFGKQAIKARHYFDTDAAGSLSDNEFTVSFWFQYRGTPGNHDHVFLLGKHLGIGGDVGTDGHSCVGLFLGNVSTYSANLRAYTGRHTGTFPDSDKGHIELSNNGAISRNTWYHIYISRTNSGANSTLAIKVANTSGTTIAESSTVITKADFSIDESGTGASSYMMGHPGGGSLTLGNGYFEDLLIYNGGVLGQAVVYNNSSEYFQASEPQITVSPAGSSATVSTSNFTGTKTYSFYDTDSTTLLQSGSSNSYSGFLSSSIAYTALVTDTNNNRVIKTFYISGGNDMSLVSGSDAGLVLQRNMLNSDELAAVMFASDPTNGGAGAALNTVLSNLNGSSASIDTRLGAEEAARAAADSSLTTRVSTEEDARAAADSSLELRLSQEESLALAEFASVDARVAADEAALAAEIAATNADVSSIDTRVAADEAALAAEIAATNADVSSVDTRVGNEESARASADSSLELRLSQEESLALAEFASVDTRIAADEAALAAEIAATNGDVSSLDTRAGGLESDVSSIDTRVAADEAALAAEIAATNADVSSVDVRVAADEAALVAAKSSIDTRVAADEAALVAAKSSIDSKFAWVAGTNSGGVLTIDSEVEMSFEDSASLIAGQAMTLIIQKA